MKVKGKSTVSIIGGADGPTSIYLTVGTGKKTRKERIRQYIYKCKRQRMEKRIFAGAHTLKEVVKYANKKYQAVEISKSERRYVKHRKNLRENLIITNKPELLGEMIANIPDREMPMDYHIYEIRIDGGHMTIEIDYIWDIFGISYSGNKKAMRQFRKIGQDLNMYYGVTEEDIKNKSQRYEALLAVLSR